MATIAPSRYGAITQRVTDGKRLTEALHPWRRRLWAQQMLRWTENGFITGIILACLLLLISRLIPWTGVFYWAIGIATASLLFALGIALLYLPSFAPTPRLIHTPLPLHYPLCNPCAL